MFEVVRAGSPALVSQTRLLIQEYADSLGLDLEFQEFEHEFADLASEYATRRVPVARTS